MLLTKYFANFESKYKSLKIIDRDWYKNNCGVISNCKSSPLKDQKGNYTEEWYRARMVWALVDSQMYPSENICVEFTIPKGSEGAKSLSPDIVVFKSADWFAHYEKWDKKLAVPDELCREFLLFWEAKNNSKKVASSVTKQLSAAMKEYQGELVFGVYFDNEPDLLIFQKEGTNPIKRYNPAKTIDGDGLLKLNLNNRDALIDLPNFKFFLGNIRATEDVSKLNFKTNQPIDEDIFRNLLEVINRMQDKLNVSHLQDLIVEFLTLKVSDEKEVKRRKKKYFDFYIKSDEITKQGFGTQSFRGRIDQLYRRVKEEYKSIFNPRLFTYIADKDQLKPQHGDDEKFLIGLVQIFQKKSILETQNTSFNQIIFNNFGNNIEKAKEKQFFTPIPIVEAIVKIINPQKEETICDPCSGICDFPAMAFRHIYKDELESLPTADKLYGFDKDHRILKLAELNLVLNGDGNANIKIMDSITNKLLSDGSVEGIDFTIENYHIDDWNNKNDDDKSVRKYDAIITNPPFGKNRDLITGKNGKWDVPENTMELYETWSVSGKPFSIDMGIIFLENAYKLLKAGGRMAIILSNSIASIEQWEQARKWFISKMRIVALFDLPAKTFGEADVATTVIVAYKPKATEKGLLKEDYEIFVKEVKYVGYTVKTKGRIVIMSPSPVINEETYEREKDSKGNDKRLSDLPDLVNSFGDWLDENKHRYKQIFKTFHGESFQKIEE